MKKTLARDKFFNFFNNKYEALTFDDVSIEPSKSKIIPRDINLETFLTPEIPLNIPLVSADMDTITEANMAIKIAMEGGLGFLWKSPDIDEQEKWVQSVKYAFNAKIDKPRTINENQTFKEVREILSKYENRFSSLIVLNNDRKVSGLLTKDRSQFAEEDDKVKDFMAKDLFMTEKNLNVDQTYKYMKKNQIPKLIIVSKSGELKGLYTFKDVKEIVEKRTPMFNRDKDGRLRVGANIGAGGDYMERAQRLLEAKCDVLLVGTAHGDSENVIKTVREIKKNFKNYEFSLVAGNVATYQGAVDLIKAGADAIKIGIGAGSICTTRVVSGIGIPQLSAVYNASKAARKYGKTAIADGGIRYSGDIVKALGAGASCAMIGKIFAQTNEAPGEIISDKNGIKYKKYRGMGSLGAMIENKTASRYQQSEILPEKLVPEGVEGAVPLTGSLSEQINLLTGGIKSGMGYVGARNIKELEKKVNFIKITNAGIIESHPHDIDIIQEPPNYSKRF
jgi:IMP dehydrogenase